MKPLLIISVSAVPAVAEFLEYLTKPEAATEAQRHREYRWQNMKTLLSFSLSVPPCLCG